MTENDILQLGHSRNGQFADRLMPAPMHGEINAWQHFTDLLYLEALRRHEFGSFVFVLGAPQGRGHGDSVDEIHPQRSVMKISGLDTAGNRARHREILQQSEQHLRKHLENTGIHRVRQASGERGCRLGYLTSNIREHCNDECNRHNKLPARLKGSQAIALARYSYRLVDTVECDNETGTKKLNGLPSEKLVSI